MLIISGAIFIAATAAVLHYKWDPIVAVVDQTLAGPKTTEQRVQQYAADVTTRLKPNFEKAGVAYPPANLTFVVLKEEERLEVYAADTKSDTCHFVRSYPILAASGHAGPKLREGDWQVPEGIYSVESLNPNSHYHLALHVGYPNAFDREKARTDGRRQLGGDIMIHGSDVSIGCVAMGDPAAEDLFVLAAQVGTKNVRLLFCPWDFRLTRKNPPTDAPVWTPELYTGLERELKKLPPPSP